MPETLSRIIVAIGEKWHNEGSYQVEKEDVVNDLGVTSHAKYVAIPLENGRFLAAAVEDDWDNTYTVVLNGTYGSEEAVRRNTRSIAQAINNRKGLRTFMGVVTLGVFEVLIRVKLAMTACKMYVLDGFAYYYYV